MKKLIGLFLILGFQAQAIHIDSNGHGDMLFIPYYSVNNGLNTLATITNHSEDIKALKINFRESLNGRAVMSYNVYLSARDTWTFAMLRTLSTLPSYSGQETATHFKTDYSCSPNLPVIYDFSPLPFDDGPALDTLPQVKEGFIEIIEMGTINADSDFAFAMLTERDGIPRDCSQLAEAWDPDGAWTTNPQLSIEPATGNLSAEVSLIDVHKGINYTYSAIAFANSFPTDTTRHSSPDESTISLNAANSTAFMFFQNQPMTMQFNRGIDAVSALIMAANVNTTFTTEGLLDSQTELALTFPTKRFYIGETGTQPPFNPHTEQIDNVCGSSGGVGLEFKAYNRHGQIPRNCIPGSAITIPRKLCGTTGVISFKSRSSDDSTAAITGSNNHLPLRQACMIRSTKMGT